MRNRFTTSLALTAALVSALTQTRSAEACGGCFAPPGAIQTVNAHRMVLSLSRTQTTLWDQFSYAGNPTDFSWILPVRSGPNVQVRLADDRFLNLVDNLTVPVLEAPRRPERYCPGCYDYASPGFADAGASADSGVTVYREETVGPYAIAVVGGTNAMAIRDWLRNNGFSVPTALNPVIDHYTAMRSDYLALRLRPGAGINRMTPVRVTVPGYQPVLPLRMIAAGIADKVGLALTVFSDSRVEATNFPNGVIRSGDLTYDFEAPTNPATDFLNAFNTLNRANGNRVWLSESVISQDRESLVSLASRIASVQPRMGTVCPDADGGTGSDSGSGSSDGGMSVDMCVEPDPSVDATVAFEGLGMGATVTRFRADLAGSALDRDLILGASTGALIDRRYSYGRVLHMPAEPPPCPPPPDCGTPPWYDSGTPFDAATGPRMDAGRLPDGAVTPPTSAEGGIRCAVTRIGAHGNDRTQWVTVSALGLALSIVLRRARRR